MAELLECGARTDAALLEASHDAGLEIESAGVIAGDVLDGVEDEEWLEWRGGLSRSGDSLGTEAPRVLRQAMASQWLVEAHIRSSEPRGGEVRLDLNIPLRARAMHRVSIDTRRWRWRHVLSIKVKQRRKARHINCLELEAVAAAIDWRLRSRARGQRYLHLVDSQVALSILCKGRSSSLRLTPVTRRIAARLLAGFMFPVFAFVKSAWNPSDEPSRQQ